MHCSISLDDDVPHHVAEMSDSYKGQEPYPPAQSDMVMFAPSIMLASQNKAKNQEGVPLKTSVQKTVSIVFTQTMQEPSHMPHDHNTGSAWEVCYIATLYILCTVLFVQQGNPSLHKEVAIKKRPP